jgi:hypothetical protein
MNQTTLNAALNPALASAVALACQHTAPAWPLDQLIAVNPYWAYVDQPIAQAAAQLASLCGTRLLMPRAFYQQAWVAKQLAVDDLQAAVEMCNATISVDELIASLMAPSNEANSLALITALLDKSDDALQVMCWRDVVIHQVSQHCASYFDDTQAVWSPDQSAGLYASWRAQTATDRTLALRMGHTRFSAQVLALPEDALALIDVASRALGLTDANQQAYFQALLLDINGWASWCAYLRWQAKLSKGDDDKIVELLAIRLAWEALLYEDQMSDTAKAIWASQWHTPQTASNAIRESQRIDWLLQTALELAYQKKLCAGLMRAPLSVVRGHHVGAGADVGHAPDALPAVQAVFCIDVRSEVFRRAFESVTSSVQTFGFAGFFGLSIDFSPLGTDLKRPQLPGLLSPAFSATQVCDSPELGQVLAQRRRAALQWQARWSAFRSSANSAFSFVESFGLAYAGKLLQASFASQAGAQRIDDAGLSAAHASLLRPRLQSVSTQDSAGNTKARSDLAHGILGAMGLTDRFSRLIVLAGHGSQSANNPHAAGLDCGACGGQTGEVNARALAALLNDTAVRQALAERDVHIPECSVFLAGLHNTTTDSFDLFDLDLLPTSHAPDLLTLKTWLGQAGQLARAERAPSLGLQALRQQPQALERAVKARANDWAQVRPEWGLANNAAFIVAPRSRSRHLDLAGRAFLHDYQWQKDGDFKVLELIMTAPMVVAHWINMQYNASTVDNPRYGSGNKLLHNVVGGHIGVFEGNGGDLRIGLPWQSLHDGETLRHTPQRLSVFIQAPQAAIDQVMKKHALVQQLVGNGWLHLFQIDSAQSIINRYESGQWQCFAEIPA